MPTTLPTALPLSPLDVPSPISLAAPNVGRICEDTGADGGALDDTADALTERHPVR